MEILEQKIEDTDLGKILLTFISLAKSGEYGNVSEVPEDDIRVGTLRDDSAEQEEYLYSVR